MMEMKDSTMLRNANSTVPVTSHMTYVNIDCL